MGKWRGKSCRIWKRDKRKKTYIDREREVKGGWIWRAEMEVQGYRYRLRSGEIDGEVEEKGGSGGPCEWEEKWMEGVKEVEGLR